MKLFVGILFCISINSYAQIIDLEHPSALSIPNNKQKSFDSLLKDLNCLKTKGLSTSCLKLNKRDTFLLFYPYESYYQDSYLFAYLKRGDSAYGTVYFDKGFTKPLQNSEAGAEWKPGFVLKYSSTINDPISLNDLLVALEDTTLRTIDTTFFISHDPNLYFAFYLDNRSVFKAIHYRHSFSSPIIRKLIEQFEALARKLPD